MLCPYWLVIIQICFSLSPRDKNVNCERREKHEKLVDIPHAKWKYFSVYVMILLIPLLIEYSGLSNLPLWKLASLSHIWYLHRFSLNILSMLSLAFPSEFAFVSFYDHLYICQDSHGESHFVHCLNYLSQTMGRKKDCLLFVADVKDSRAVWWGSFSETRPLPQRRALWVCAFCADTSLNSTLSVSGIKE